MAEVFSLQKNYNAYLTHSEELRSALQRQAWDDVEQYLLWREKELPTMLSSHNLSQEYTTIQKEFLNKIIILDAQTIVILREKITEIKMQIKSTCMEFNFLSYVRNM